MFAFKIEVILDGAWDSNSCELQSIDEDLEMVDVCENLLDFVFLARTKLDFTSEKGSKAELEAISH